MKKKLAAIVFVIVLVISIVPFSAFADYAVYSPEFPDLVFFKVDSTGEYYVYSGGGSSVTSYRNGVLYVGQIYSDGTMKYYISADGYDSLATAYSAVMTNSVNYHLITAVNYDFSLIPFSYEYSEGDNYNLISDVHYWGSRFTSVAYQDIRNGLPANHSKTRDENITITITDKIFCHVNYNEVHCQIENKHEWVQKGSDLTLKAYPQPYFTFYGITSYISASPNASRDTITINHYPGSETDYIEFEVKNVKGTLNVSVNASRYYLIGYDLSHITSSNSSEYILAGQTYVTSLVIEDGYVIEDIKIQMAGIDITSQAYDPETRTVTATSVHGDLIIIAKAVFDEAGTLIDINLNLSNINDLLTRILSFLTQGSTEYDDDKSNVEGKIDDYNQAETSLIDDVIGKADDVMDTSIDQDIIDFMIDFRLNSFIYDNAFVLTGLSFVGVFMLVGYLIFGKKGHG